ncbi:MAG: GNAT family N-acetyltransferase [Acidobacteriota bacterium]|nr:GNAT family N-acetyltransferase [Acidobacteriota bacterium]
MATDGASIRRALPGEADLLTALTLRSKAYWGYDREFMEAATAELTFRPEKYPGLEVYVLETGTRVVGFCSLIPRSAVEVELDALFVEPDSIRYGYGKTLWDYAVLRARELGFEEMTFTSDPHAEGFYRERGAEKVGEKASNITPSRVLPFMRYRLSK